MFTNPFIIAELCCNHGGDLSVALKLIEQAKRCGVSAVKLQKRDNKSLFTDEFYNKPYENPNSFGATYGHHREALEFNEEQYSILKQYAEALGLVFFATPFDFASVEFLERVGVQLYKIASSDCDNIPLIKRVLQTGKPAIVSTGAASWEDIDRVYSLLQQFPGKHALLHCVAQYPVKPENVNLMAISAMKARYPDAHIGFSDHYNGICMSEAALMAGATIFEKHFTLDHTMKGTDHALSLEPQGMQSLVQNLHRIKVAHGDGNKVVRDFEVPAKEKLGKSVYAKKFIAKGAVVSADDFCIKSPAGGLSPAKLEELEGATVKFDICPASPIKEGDYDRK